MLSVGFRSRECFRVSVSRFFTMSLHFLNRRRPLVVQSYETEMADVSAATSLLPISCNQHAVAVFAGEDQADLAYSPQSAILWHANALPASLTISLGARVASPGPHTIRDRKNRRVFTAVGVKIPSGPTLTVVAIPLQQCWRIRRTCFEFMNYVYIVGLMPVVKHPNARSRESSS